MSQISVKRKRTEAKQSQFLAAFAELGTICHAANVSGLSYSDHYKWLERDPTYPARFEEACNKSRDKLEREAIRRATEGVARKRFYPKGHRYEGQEYTEFEYSNNLLIFLLKGNLPEKYRERYDVNQTTKAEVHVKVESLDLPLEARRQLLDAMRKTNGSQSAN